MDDGELPEKGVPFFEAWEILSTERERREWRDAVDRGAMEARSLLMQASLMFHLKHGNLAAYGIRVQDAPYHGPEQIPAQLFDDHVAIRQRGFLFDRQSASPCRSNLDVGDSQCRCQLALAGQ